MECSKCGDDAVYDRKYEGRALCGEHFSRDIEKKVRRTVHEHDMVESGDRICVALSGGKDSSLTLKILSDMLGKRRDIELFALAIDEGIEGYRGPSLELAGELCEGLDVELETVSYSQEVGKSMDEILEDKPDARACTYCGVFRRHLLNRHARELEATKVATGHNLDDELQSVFMNYLKGDIKRLARMGAEPATADDEAFIPRIKPLRNIPEREVGLYCMINDLPFHGDECPNAHDSVRFDVREFLNEMEDKYPGTKFTALAAFDKLLPVLREKVTREGDDVNRCDKCGEPCSGEVCKACKLKVTIDG